MTSADGLTWASQTFPSLGVIGRMMYSTLLSKWLLGYTDSATRTNALLTNGDGINNWQLESTPNVAVVGMAESSNTIVLVGGTTILYLKP